MSLQRSRHAGSPPLFAGQARLRPPLSSSRSMNLVTVMRLRRAGSMWNCLIAASIVAEGRKIVDLQREIVERLKVLDRRTVHAEWLRQIFEQSPAILWEHRAALMTTDLLTTNDRSERPMRRFLF